ncbi:hypothetical protein TNCT_482271 [Trichonephila clavata]|uniref:DUF6570 domain-containing protein n=1 Tax=Trichonephila clavata TaxID=2740835 RepID=A0A8X6KQJ4_TRICU|nr:hypothetical protein TNCT_482271 [Trichonephila clavata]
MVVVTEHLENLNILREYNISRPRVYEALRWLINNNALYQEVIIYSDAQILQEDLIRVTQAINNENAQNNNQALLEPATASAVEKQPTLMMLIKLSIIQYVFYELLGIKGTIKFSIQTMQAANAVLWFWRTL